MRGNLLDDIDGRVGFVNQGVNESKPGGVTWYDCVYTIQK